MGKVLVSESSLKNIANAIRVKNGSTTKYKPADMAPAIAEIPTGVDVSDTTATATDVLAGKTFYGADGKLVTGVYTGEIYNTNKDVNIYSDEAWKVDVKAVDHQTITARPRMEWNQESDGRYRARFYTHIDDMTIKTDIGYIPGTITQTVDKVKQIITVSSTDAGLIEPLVKDGWTQVYEANRAFYDKIGGNQLAPEAVTGKILVTGMDGAVYSYTTQHAPYRGTWLTSYEKATAYRNDFITSMPSLGISYWHNIQELYLKNLSGEVDYGFLVGCESLKKVEVGDVSAFGSGAFCGCEALEEIILHAPSVPAVEMDIIVSGYYVATSDQSFTEVPSTCKLYVPASAIDAYKADSTWGTKFKGHIFAIEDMAT